MQSRNELSLLMPLCELSAKSRGCLLSFDLIDWFGFPHQKAHSAWAISAKLYNLLYIQI